jgi:hypothetical protein
VAIGGGIGWLLGRLHRVLTPEIHWQDRALHDGDEGVLALLSGAGTLTGGRRLRSALRASQFARDAERYDGPRVDLSDPSRPCCRWNTINACLGRGRGL